MEKRRFSLGALLVATAVAAVAATFLFVVVPQFLMYAAESGTSPALPLGGSLFIIYFVVAGWWQLRVEKPPSEGALGDRASEE